MLQECAHSFPTELFVVAVVTILSIAGFLLLVGYVRGRGKRIARRDSQTPPRTDKFDTTLGELHDMREALRPLGHVRATSRRDPGDHR